MQIAKYAKAACAASLQALVILGCTTAPGTTTAAPTPIYHHTTWLKGSHVYLDVWSRGVEIVSKPWIGDPYASFYLGQRWENFAYDPDWDHIDVLPAPGYKGPDKLVYGRTGEVVTY